MYRPKAWRSLLIIYLLWQNNFVRSFTEWFSNCFFNCSLGNRYFWRCMLEHTKRQVHKRKFLSRCLVMFITAIYLLFLLNLKLPKNKSIYIQMITSPLHEKIYTTHFHLNGFAPGLRWFYERLQLYFKSVAIFWSCNVARRLCHAAEA